MRYTGCNVQTSTLKSLFESIPFKKIEEAKEYVHPSCNVCRYKKICGSGYLHHRYSKENGFLNKNIYCEALFMLYLHIEKFLIKQGVSSERIDSELQK